MGEDDGQLRVSLDSDDTLRMFARWLEYMNEPFQLHKTMDRRDGNKCHQEIPSSYSCLQESIETIADNDDGRRECVAPLCLPCSVIPRVIEKLSLGRLNSSQRILYCSVIASGA